MNCPHHKNLTRGEGDCVECELDRVRGERDRAVIENEAFESGRLRRVYAANEVDFAFVLTLGNGKGRKFPTIDEAVGTLLAEIGGGA